MPTISTPSYRHVLACAALAALALVPAASRAAKSGDTFKDWRIQCEQPKGAPAELCHAYQLVSMKDTKKPIVHMAIGYPPKQTEPVAILTVPLGVALQAGIQIKVDDGEPLRVPYNVCAQNGCQAGVKIDAALLKSLRGGSQAHISFANLQRQAVDVPVSLKGLSAALDALTK
ncbi:invasion associated locus B family protein [Nitrogeniibacter mangrovi]|uniref:Invasion associated locus B family protein n=1 Tax=Nitrogeniibacter mangrovi TaxID=2016596 RepID=A0A6C1B2K0_9RHOO|nr:invasion associated locus B family protein [Nitrogeniibacter mangrovi]QID17871.1 invasion associated locus B family protein [Nitrogeniibacter mangrovi]